MTHDLSRRVEVGALSRVEGEGGLRVVLDGGRVVEAALEIYEPPRFFEGFLVGRSYREVPDITARICGICPVAYQMSSCQALEAAHGVTVSPQVKALRRLLYCGEWLQSHALHVYFLHAPDFLGCADAVALAERDPAALQRGLLLKKAGNELMRVIGGRAVHPVNVRVGGFYRAPGAAQVRGLGELLSAALEAARRTVEWVAGFDFPDVEGDYLFVSLLGEGEYPLDRGPVGASTGERWTPEEFAEVAVEEQVPRSTALHARLHGRQPYLTGPLARYALNRPLLTPLAAEAAAGAGLGAVCTNPFRSIVVRAVEMVFACEEAIRLAAGYEVPEPPAAEIPVPQGQVTGAGATEAPRGLLLHRYVVGEDGLVKKARIMPPTSQNQLTVEADLARVAEASLGLSLEDLTARAETAVRNHDPCISCAAHFLTVTLEGT